MGKVFRMKRFGLSVLWVSLVASAFGQAIPVEVVEHGGTYLMKREGVPYYIRGVGGTERLEGIAEIGGNSVRTWVPPEEAFLDAAHQAGLSVCVGLWIEHERHGFDYDDAEAVAEQIARHQSSIDRLKDHPAVLLWGIGNEVELSYTNPKVWDVVEAVARYAKKVDPHHPTMTVLSHVPEEAVHEIRERCPSIDILGSNSYAGITVLSQAIADAGWDGPYIVTEWGTNGSWEVDKTDWGAELEPSSTEKARQRAERLAIIGNDRDRCLGGYAFYWGNKQETTATWFNLFMEDGRHTGEYEVLRHVWSGRGAPVFAPEIGELTLNGKRAASSVRIGAGETAEAAFALTNSPRELEVVWVVKSESADKRIGGDAEKRAEILDVPMRRSGDFKMEFTAPEEAGPYRLYLFLRGPENSAATANFPFYVEG